MRRLGGTFGTHGILYHTGGFVYVAYIIYLLYTNRHKLQSTPKLRVQVKQLITYKEWFSLSLTCNRTVNLRLFLYFGP